MRFAEPFPPEPVEEQPGPSSEGLQRADELPSGGDEREKDDLRDDLDDDEDLAADDEG